MEKKQIRNLIILLVVLIVCIGGYFGMKNFNEKTEAASEAASEAAEAKEQISTVSSGSITKLSWKYDGADVTITKGGADGDDVWYNGSVSLNSVESMLDSVSDIESTKTITGDDINMDDFGLSDPSNVITAETSDGKSIKITLGIQNQITNDYYCYLNDDTSKVYTISSSLYYSFDKDPSDLEAGK
ncbi:MAG: DUF4340 domain-containing protein [Lachnospiraceae bacterium]|nr:DUF4340 domain-containing protein [Lachnospiraceae bacterium]